MFVVIVLDLILLNTLYFVFGEFSYVPMAAHGFFLWNVSYLVSILAIPPLAHTRYARAEDIVSRVFKATLLLILVFSLYLYVDGYSRYGFWPALALGGSLFLVLCLSRMLSHSILKGYRRNAKHANTVVFVGAGHNLAYLYQCMVGDFSKGYRFLGYFDDHVSVNLPEQANRIGMVDECIAWLEKADPKPQMLFCNLPSARSEEIVDIINYCDSHFIRFYSVPNVRNYVHRAMEVEMINGMPVLSLRKEPLRKTYNRVIKRAFDIVVSGVFLVTCFWWIYLIVALITKITMPGPVFFRQKRNGLLGEEFYCLKFRSMKVNKDADRLQATKDDPRKTKWGNLMRHYSIDELPQFINVFMGSMSVVGPRPHMVRHTEEYSALIDKYMVRHFVKPGITGWAQVSGARGETEYLWQMEDRIKKDIWYIENWSLWLDIKIMYYTVRNAVFGDGQAY